MLFQNIFACVFLRGKS